MLEWTAAFANDPMGRQHRLLPIRIRECELIGIFAHIIYIDLVNVNQGEAQKKLLEGVIKGRIKPETAPIYPGLQGSAPLYPGISSSIDAEKKINADMVVFEAIRDTATTVTKIEQFFQEENVFTEKLADVSVYNSVASDFYKYSEKQIEEIIKFELFLKQCGYNVDIKRNDLTTRQEIMRFQIDNSLYSDGILGPKTLEPLMILSNTPRGMKGSPISATLTREKRHG